jgi:MFS-type transporter involved in bile tolerance (Atg22 family)
LFFKLCFNDVLFPVAYLTYFLEFTPLRTAIAFGCSLLCSIPGATFSTFVARKLDPIRAARINMVILIFTIVVFALILNGPGQYTRTNLYFAFIGFNGGWKVTMDRLISSTIIPDDQSTEMMGFFLFADQWLLWLPLLVYTMLNEAGVAPQINVIILSSYLCVSLLFLCMTGSYATARAEVNRDSVYMDKDAAAAAAAAATSSDVDATVGAKDDEKAGDEESSPTVQAEETLAEA